MSTAPKFQNAKFWILTLTDRDISSTVPVFIISTADPLLVVGCGYMDWIGLAQDRDRWRALVSAVMNLRVP